MKAFCGGWVKIINCCMVILLVASAVLYPPPVSAAPHAAQIAFGYVQADPAETRMPEPEALLSEATLSAPPLEVVSTTETAVPSETTSTEMVTPTETSTTLPTKTSVPAPSEMSTPLPTETTAPVLTDTNIPEPTEASTSMVTEISNPIPTETSIPIPTETSTLTLVETETPTTTPTQGLASPHIGAESGSSATPAIPLCGTQSQIPMEECNALVALYNSTNGYGWNNKDGWLVDDTPCNTWAGIACTNGHVTTLYLRNYYLTGTIPSSISNLTNLTTLDLSNNQLTGTIPSSLSNLTNLTTLDLSSNSLWWVIPPALGNLANLNTLNLSGNQLTGTIPTTLDNLANLNTLNLSGNQLTGTIPTTLGNLANLNTLNLSGNQLTGTIPTTLGNLANLNTLSLGGNQLTGTIPTTLGNLVNLGTLYLYNNQLSGEIPTSITNLVNISDGYLNLDYNDLISTNEVVRAYMSQKDPNWENTQNGPFSSCAVVRGIPQTECEALSALYTSTNGSHWNSHAHWLEIDSPCLWEGVVCNEGHVTELNLFTNQLTGSIPPDLGNLTNLTTLNLFTNQLTGSIPPDLSNLTNLTTLSLSSNQLNGTIPTALDNLTNLSYLDLSYNQLTGSIPASLGNLTNLNTLYLVSNQLTGNIPTSITNLINLIESSLDLGYNNLTTTDTAVRAYLDQKDPDWESTQSGPFSSCASVRGITQAECAVLVTLYTNAKGTNWRDHTNWLEKDAPCIWFGVSCDSGHVTGLSLRENKLTGTIPPTLGNLTNLNVLDLSYNQITGSIPTVLGNLTNLGYLDLNYNQITGSIPTALGNLANLYFLSLIGNQITGSIPTVLGNLTNLGYLDLSYNQLTGSIPTTLGNLTNLSYLYLSGNQLNGEIPTSITNLVYANLDLGSNYLTSTDDTVRSYLAERDPDWEITQSGGPFSTCATVRGISPAECEVLDIFYINTNGNGWTYHTNWKQTDNPCSWYGVSCASGHITMLEIGNNQLTGTIPPTLGNLTNLNYLYLSSNQLTGSIPSALGNLTNLTTLDLSNNQLNGTIPPELANLTNLSNLRLSNNLLGGTIPSELGNQIRLNEFYLNNNQFRGEIPSSITTLLATYYGSETLDLSYNYLISTDDMVRYYLTLKDPDWESTQFTCYSLTLSASPAAGGIPSVSPTHSSGCSTGQYMTGETLTLSPGTKPRYGFSNWTGATVTNNVMMMPASAKTVTANYTASGGLVPLLPKVAITNSRPTYTWTAAANATAYDLYINNSLAQTLTPASANCATVTRNCTATPARYLKAGIHTWKVTARNTYGSATSILQPFIQLSPLYGFDSQFNGSMSGLLNVQGTWLTNTTSLYSNTLSLVAGPVPGPHYQASIYYNANFTTLDYQVQVMRSGCETCATKMFVRGDGIPVFAGWKNGYQFNIKRNGYYYVGKTVNGNLITLKNWTPSAAIKTGSNWNLLRVTASGSSLKFYINNILVWSGSDTARSVGRVGMGLYSNGTGGINRLYANYATLTTTVLSAPHSETSSQTQDMTKPEKIDPLGGNY